MRARKAQKDEERGKKYFIFHQQKRSFGIVRRLEFAPLDSNLRAEAKLTRRSTLIGRTFCVCVCVRVYATAKAVRNSPPTKKATHEIAPGIRRTKLIIGHLRLHLSHFAVFLQRRCSSASSSSPSFSAKLSSAKLCRRRLVSLLRNALVKSVKLAAAAMAQNSRPVARHVVCVSRVRVRVCGLHLAPQKRERKRS